MIKRFLFIITLSTIFVFTFSTGVYAREKMSHTEEKNVNAEGVEKVHFRDINFTDFTYIGEDGRSSFSITITYTVETDDEEEFEEMLSEFDFDIFTSDETVTMRLIHPKKRDYGLFKRLFRRKEWRVILDVKGPRTVDMDIDSDFSEILTEHTSGNLVFNVDFTSTICRDHKGRLRTNLDFGDFKTEELDGSFNINTDFGNVDLELAHLADDSQANVSFGDIDIGLPYNTGAEFHVNKSFGSINFHTRGPLTFEGRKGNRRILNDGGCIIDLDAEFGSISVRDNVKEYKGADKKPEKNNRQTERKVRKPEPKPVFTEGIISSIKIRGTRLLNREDVEGMLNINTGKHY
ncbi:MAG TPA: hypothetical protein VMZ04_04240, partial [Anaerolineae bacterium]|nr:hypothetical protein [Anaerolineae bacterium]